MSLPGFATLEGTSRYKDRFSSLCAEDHFRDLLKKVNLERQDYQK
jgi:hypothetical protein